MNATAQAIQKKQDQPVIAQYLERFKFKWVNEEEEPYFFEIKIQVDEITKDVSLIVTDFAEEDEMEEAKMLWENQISDLKMVLGSA